MTNQPRLNQQPRHLTPEEVILDCEDNWREYGDNKWEVVAQAIRQHYNKKLQSIPRLCNGNIKAKDIEDAFKEDA